MRVAALFDVHGNLPALEAVLRDVAAADVDVVVCGGDLASGPMPVEALAAMRALKRPVRFVRGNADRVLDFAGRESGSRELWQESRIWVAQQLGDEALAFLAALPLDEVVDVPGLGPVRFCHGAPGSDEIPVTRLTPDDRLRELLAGVDERIVVCGHTHIQFDRIVDGVRLVNAGSVGVPYEVRAGAYWLLLSDAGLEFRRTAYDVEAAAMRILATGYPNREHFVAQIAVADDAERPARMSAVIEGAAS